MAESTSSATSAVAETAPEPSILDQLLTGLSTVFTIEVLFKVVVFLVILVVARVIGKIAARSAGAAMDKSKRKPSALLREFVVGWTARGIFLLGLLIALENLGVRVGPLLAGLGIAGFVLGFALQGTLNNFASGLMILVYQPFDVGDVVEIDGVLGKVDALTIVNTSILTFDNRKVMLPNANVWGSTITNLTAMPTRRVDFNLGVSYQADLDRTLELVRAHINAHEKVLEDPPITVEILSHDDSSIGIVCRAWAKTEDYWTVFFDLKRTLKQLLDREGIEIPFPQRVVHMVRDTDADPT